MYGFESFHIIVINGSIQNKLICGCVCVCSAYDAHMKERERESSSQASVSLNGFKTCLVKVTILSIVK